MKHEPYIQTDQGASGKLQAANRLSAGFFLRTLALLQTLPGVDLMLGIVQLTVAAGNLAYIDRDPEESERYSEYETPAPNSLQRPVSVLYVSTALGIPYETARRYVGRLLETGACARVPRGLVTPTQANLSPAAFDRIHKSAANTRLFHRRLKAAGFPFDHGDIEARPAGNGKVRVAVRLVCGYFLRSLGLMTNLQSGDVMLTVVLLTIQAGNIAHIDQDSVEPGKYSEFENPAPVSEQRPVSVLYVATALGLPYETTRRYVGRLVKTGDCQRVSRGLVTPTQAVVTGASFQRQSRNAANIRQLFRSLKAAGFPLED